MNILNISANPACEYDDLFCLLKTTNLWDFTETKVVDFTTSIRRIGSSTIQFFLLDF